MGTWCWIGLVVFSGLGGLVIGYGLGWVHGTAHEPAAVAAAVRRMRQGRGLDG